MKYCTRDGRFNDGTFGEKRVREGILERIRAKKNRAKKFPNICNQIAEKKKSN